jgi:phenolic acid decarboxylase
VTKQSTNSGHDLDFRPDGSDESYVVYCVQPNNDRPSAPQRYEKVTGSVAAYDSNFAKTKVILYYGYPVNGGGFQEQYNLTALQFREITKKALDTTHGGNEYYKGLLGGISTQQEYDCYKALLAKANQAGSITLPDNYVCEIYYPVGAIGHYQCVALAFLKTTPTPTPSETTVKMSKTDVGGKELAGATVQILKADDKSVVTEWTSTTTPHEVTLAAGSYLFHEVAAPNGYQIATDIAFTIAEDGTVTKDGQTVTGDAPIVMVDNYADQKFTFSKQDADGNELEGATIELRKEDGTVVEKWTSDGTNHTVTVTPGTYKLVETAAPKGYTIATAITVTVAADGTITKDGETVTGDAPIVMVDNYADQKFTFSKQDADGNELEGATIELQKEDGTVVETWVSDGTTHTFDVAPGTYKLVETAAPEGYTIATTITVTVAADGTVTKDGEMVTGDAPIIMVDGFDDEDSDTPNTPVPDEPNNNIVPNTPEDDTPTPGGDTPTTGDTPNKDTPTTTVTKTTPTPTTTTVTTTNPKTGDTTHTGMWITVLAASLIGAVELAVVLAAKHKRKL